MHIYIGGECTQSKNTQTVQTESNAFCCIKTRLRKGHQGANGKLFIYTSQKEHVFMAYAIPMPDGGGGVTAADVACPSDELAQSKPCARTPRAKAHTGKLRLTKLGASD